MSLIQKLKNNKLRFIVALVILLIAGGGIYYSVFRDNSPQGSSTKTNYDPPTEEDKKSVSDNKQRIVDREADLKKQSSSQQDGKKNIKPILTYAGQYDSDVEVGAYINVFEEGGTCTATFTRGTTSVTKSVMAVRGANAVNCPAMVVSSAELNNKGMYSVSVSYNSSTTYGVSDPKEIEVK